MPYKRDQFFGVYIEELNFSVLCNRGLCFQIVKITQSKLKNFKICLLQSKNDSVSNRTIAVGIIRYCGKLLNGFGGGADFL